MSNPKNSIPSGFYKEPVPHIAQDSPFVSMMERFRFAAEILDLNEGVFKYLSSPEKVVVVSIPVTMDDGCLEVFEGYRVIHNSILGPSKGGLPLVNKLSQHVAPLTGIIQGKGFFKSLFVGIQQDKVGVSFGNVNP